MFVDIDQKEYRKIKMFAEIQEVLNTHSIHIYNFKYFLISKEFIQKKKNKEGKIILTLKTEGNIFKDMHPWKLIINILNKYTYSLNEIIDFLPQLEEKNWIEERHKIIKDTQMRLLQIRREIEREERAVFELKNEGIIKEEKQIRKNQIRNKPDLSIKYLCMELFVIIIFCLGVILYGFSHLNP